MAGFFNEFLKGAEAGFFGTEFLRDAQHASKTFRTNAYANAPKHKFLFHVYFDINTQFLPDDSKLNIKKSNFSVLVKSIDLPKFSAQIEELNQYNRKRLVQTKMKFDPINISMHDDNNNLVKSLWLAYYSYYYKDPSQLESSEMTNAADIEDAGLRLNSAGIRDIYNASTYGNDDWGFIGETARPAVALGQSGAIGNIKAPFFNSIKIYGFNQHNFVLYKLINPLIESFSHDTYDYSQGAAVMENKMSLRFENVKYYTGALDGKNPEAMVPGFGSTELYDRVLSPNARPGSQSTILGEGGLLAGAGGVLDDLASGNLLGAVQKAGSTVKTFSKPGALSGAFKDDLNRGVQGGPNPSRNTLFSFPNLTSSKTLPKFY
jgi:hypothetical protein